MKWITILLCVTVTVPCLSIVNWTIKVKTGDGYYDEGEGGMIQLQDEKGGIQNITLEGYFEVGSTEWFQVNSTITVPSKLTVYKKATNGWGLDFIDTRFFNKQYGYLPRPKAEITFSDGPRHFVFNCQCWIKYRDKVIYAVQVQETEQEAKLTTDVHPVVTTPDKPAEMSGKPDTLFVSEITSITPERASTGTPLSAITKMTTARPTDSASSSTLTTGVSERTEVGTLAPSTTQKVSTTTITTWPTANTPTEITEVIHSRNTSGTNESLCPCDCGLRYYGDTDCSLDDVDCVLSVLREHLIVDVESTSSFKRTKISADDDRTSSRMIGAIGVIFLVAALLIIVIPDCIRMFSF